MWNVVYYKYVYDKRYNLIKQTINSQIKKFFQYLFDNLSEKILVILTNQSAPLADPGDIQLSNVIYSNINKLYQKNLLYDVLLLTGACAFFERTLKILSNYESINHVVLINVERIIDITYNFFKKYRLLSKSGSCLPFDKNRDGTVLSSAFGIVWLSRSLDSKLQIIDVDCIYEPTNGYNPNELNIGHKQLFKNFKFSPHFIKLHGTGTIIGDKIENEFINECFPNIKLFAIKSHIGHCLFCDFIEILYTYDYICNFNRIPGVKNVTDPINNNLLISDYEINKNYLNILSLSKGFGGECGYSLYKILL